MERARLKELVQIALLSAGILAIGFMALLFVTTLVVDHPYQLDVREGAQLCTAQALQQGRNPWAPENAPSDYNCYGVAGPWLAAALPAAASSPLVAYRLLNLLYAGLAMLLLGLLTARLASSALVGLGAALVYGAGMTDGVGMLARPDALAALAFLLPFIVYGFSQRRGAVLLAMALAALSILTKPYAILSAPLLGLMVWQQRGWREAFGAGAAFALMLAATLALVEQRWPGYLACTVGIHGNASSLRWSYARSMNWMYLHNGYWALLALGAVGWARFGRGLAALTWALPLLAVLAVLDLYLTRHEGGALHYFYQLQQPLTLLALAQLWAPRPKGERWLELGLVLAALVCIYYSAVPRFKHARDSQGWESMRIMVRESRHPLAPPILTALLVEEGKQVVDNGQTEYLGLAGKWPQGAELRAAAQEWQRRRDQGLRDGDWDLVLEDPLMPLDPALLKRYTRHGQYFKLNKNLLLRVYALD